MGFTIRGHYAVSFTENASNIVFSEVESPMRISYFIDDNVIVDNVELHPDANGEVTIHVRNWFGLSLRWPVHTQPPKISHRLRGVLTKVAKV